MAAPQVAAVAAMVRHLNPDLSAADIIGSSSAPRAGRRRRLERELGWGILDAGAAITAARARTAARRPRGVKRSHKLQGGAGSRCA